VRPSQKEENHTNALVGSWTGHWLDVNFSEKFDAMARAHVTHPPEVARISSPRNHTFLPLMKAYYTLTGAFTFTRATVRPRPRPSTAAG